MAMTPIMSVDGPDVVKADPPPGAELDIPLRGLRLSEVATSGRLFELDRLEAYYRGTQDSGKMYDWDGQLMGYGGEADIKPGWYVPMKRRRPAARYDMGRLIVSRLTAMVFGEGRFPELSVEGDEDAEDYCKALVNASRLPARMVEARNLGGAIGTACMSFAFKRGNPRVEVHNAKTITVLSWADEDERVVKAVLKAYAYPRQVFDPASGKLKRVNYYYARYWDQEREIVWKPIPQSVAATQRWQAYPSKSVTHNFGFCPFYWVQNIAESDQPDGGSDYEGLTENFDQINQLLSAKVRGVKANCDPTLVVKMDPAMNDGSSVRKGSDNAIFSPGGADYLTLDSGAMKAAADTMEKLRAYSLDVAGVVLADADKISGAAQSAQAMRILYAPMLAKCDLLREQYGTFGLKRIILGMLEAARKLKGEVVIDEATGETLANAINLPPRVMAQESADAEGDAVKAMVERTPGASSDLSLNWSPYFQPTWGDIKQATDAVLAANGGKATISLKTGIAALADMYGVTDVDEEEHSLQREADEAVRRAQESMMLGGPEPAYTTEDDASVAAVDGGTERQAEDE